MSRADARSVVAQHASELPAVHQRILVEALVRVTLSKAEFLAGVAELLARADVVA
jgi:hypothetical protein